MTETAEATSTLEPSAAALAAAGAGCGQTHVNTDYWSSSYVPVQTPALSAGVMHLLSLLPVLSSKAQHTDPLHVTALSLVVELAESQFYGNYF